MSVFGGDSWAREAQQRKRRLEDLVVEGLDGSSYKKLSNGKYACLLCPNYPILDSPLMLSMHGKGSRHRGAESRLKERELIRQDEMKKRIALLDCSTGSSSSTTTSSSQQFKLASKPLIEQTRNAATEILHYKTPSQKTANESYDVKLSYSHSTNGPPNSNDNGSASATKAADKVVAQQQSDYRERRERELKFIAAGWKRDCHGRWFRDENVEFDSDEEDPNVCFL